MGAEKIKEVFKMTSIDKNALTKEQIEKAMACQTADELMELAKTEGFDITKDEAEAYMAELADVELDDEALSKAAGGGCYPKCNRDNWIPL